MMIPIYDSGHGFDTTGKRSKGFYLPNGKVELKENSVNEAVANKLSMMHYLKGTEAHFITQEWIDVLLEERCRRERKIAIEIKRRGLSSYFMSIHADAYRIKNAAKGGTFFYYSESGKKLAEHFTQYLGDNGYDLDLRKPKKARYKVLVDTSSPAILFEMGFMTTRHDLDYLKKDSFRNKTAKLLYEAGLEL